MVEVSCIIREHTLACTKRRSKDDQDSGIHLTSCPATTARLSVVSSDVERQSSETNITLTPATTPASPVSSTLLFMLSYPHMPWLASVWQVKKKFVNY